MREPKTWLDYWRIVPEETGLSAYCAREHTTELLTWLEERLRDVEAGRPVNAERLMADVHNRLSRLEHTLEGLECESHGQSFDEFLINQAQFHKAPGPRLTMNP